MTELSIIKELLEQDIINESQYNDFMKIKRPEAKNKEHKTKNSSSTTSELCIEECFTDSEVKVLKEYLFKEDKNKFVFWLQEILLEACTAKLFISAPDDFKHKQTIVEPSVYYYARKWNMLQTLSLDPTIRENFNIHRFGVFEHVLKKLLLADLSKN